MLPKSTFYKIFVLSISYIFFSVNLLGQSMHADSLLKLINPINHDSINGNIYYELARTNYLGDTKNALEWSKEGAKYFKKNEDYPKMTRCMNLEAVCLLILGRPDESIKLHYKILKIREEINEPDAISETLINIGNNFYRGQDINQALHFYLKSKDLALLKNNIKILSSVYNNLANCYTDNYNATRSNKDKLLAIKYSKMALSYKKKLKTDKTYENSYATLARLYFDSDDLPSALEYAKKGEYFAVANNNHELVGSCKIMLAKIAIENKDLLRAQKKVDELETYIRNKNIPHILNLFDEDIDNIRSQIENSKSYNAELVDSLNAIEHHNLLIARQNIREELKIKYDTEKKELDNANLLLNTKIEQDKADKNKIISIISITFVGILIALVGNLMKKNRFITSSKVAIQKQAAQLQEQNILLKQSETFKTKLFSIISHDLKSPISTLKSIVELSTDVNLTAEQHTMLMKEIKQELDITYSLLNDLLFWSKTQIQSNSINWQWFNLHHVIERCMNTLYTNINVKQLHVTNTLPKDLEIYGDEIRCEFIIRNILHNAIKYSNINQNIQLGVHEHAQSWNFYVKDNGIGISPEQMQKMFLSDYARDSKKGTLDEQGSGIGLLLCHDFAESLGWRLFVESKINHGTTFHILMNKNNIEANKSVNNENSSTMENEYLSPINNNN